MCAAGYPTLVTAGAEQPYAARLRLDLDVMGGAVRVGTVGGRLLLIDDLRVAATASYAPTRDLLFSVVLPGLDRTLHDGGERTTLLAPGDAEARVYDVVWRDPGVPQRTVGLLAGVKLPTAPVEHDVQGAPLPAELQPGCSSVVPYVGAAFGTGGPVVSARGTVLAYLPFSVRAAPHPGDSLRWSAWLQVQPERVLATRFGVRGRIDGTGELAPGVADLNSGGFVGYVTSDVIVSPAQDLVLSIGAAFPVVQLWLGEHHESAMGSVQLAYDF